MSNQKHVYKFGNRTAEGDATMKNLLGGKGANLAEMNLIGVPVPAGFTITTEVCNDYYIKGRENTYRIRAGDYPADDKPHPRKDCRSAVRMAP